MIDDVPDDFCDYREQSKAKKSMDEYLKGLNDVQRQAVTTTEGPVMVVAGPGSGKTRVLTFRIAHLINQGVPPQEILALTFTNKSAKEMVERIRHVVGAKADQVWAGTFHSVFARILRMEADKIGFPTNFTIYDTADSKNLIKTIVAELRLPKDQYPPNAVYGRISAAKSKLISPKKYASDQKLLSMDKMNKLGLFYKIYERYVNRCKQAGAMDFDDLLYRTYQLIQNVPDVLSKYRGRFKYILVDEFQDTNYLQYAIIHKLVKYEGSAKNICIVGDDAQSIYAFRGATIQNILDFERDFPTTQTFKLEQNYRSTPHIIRAANTLIKQNKDQIPKEIWTEESKGNKIQLLKAVTDSEEGRKVADTILDYKNRHHLDNKEIAILYRTNAQSRIFEESLRKYNIPYKVYGGLSFYQRKEVKDMLAYFRLAINPNDEEALRRAINYPKRGIGPGTLSKFSDYALENNISLWEAMSKVQLGGRGGKQVQDFVKLIKEAGNKALKESAYDAALFIYKSSKIGSVLKEEKTIESMSRLENVEALLNGIQEYTEADEAGDVIRLDAEERTLAHYIQQIALLTDLDTDGTDNNHIMLMSVHAAKGLEFDGVVVVGMEENLFPSFMSKDDPKDLDEERRLFYVAITRARRHLSLSFASSRYRYGKVVYNSPSRFLDEIDPESFENASIMHMTANANASTQERESFSSRGPTLRGNFKPVSTAMRPSFAVDPKDFKPSPASSIQAGQEVLHIKFGKGKVVDLDGTGDALTATINFYNIDNPERRLRLKFAKLQILD